MLFYRTNRDNRHIRYLAQGLDFFPVHVCKLVLDFSFTEERVLLRRHEVSLKSEA